MLLMVHFMITVCLMTFDLICEAQMYFHLSEPFCKLVGNSTDGGSLVGPKVVSGIAHNVFAGLQDETDLKL